MPFVDYATEDELKKKQEQGQQTAPTTQQSTALSTGPTGGAQIGTGKGSGWTNLQPYLTNNAGQGAATTQQLLDPKQNQIKDAVDSLNKEANDTRAKIGQSTVQRNTALENQVKTSPTAIDKNAYNSYVNQSYSGPNVYAPSVDTEKKWNGLQTQTSLQQVADPKTIGQQLKKSNYTYGLGKLDSYLVGAEGGQTVDKFNEANKGIMTDRQATVGGVNSAIEQAKRDSAASIQSLRDTTNQAYKDTLARAQGTKGQAESAAFDQAYVEIQKRFADAGVDAPSGITGLSTYIRPTEGYSWQDSVDDSTLQALNTLADIDSDPGTNLVTKGSRSPLGVDWEKLDAYINAAKAPKGSTGTVSEDGFTHTATGPVYDEYGNRLDDGLTAEELYRRLNKTKV